MKDKIYTLNSGTKIYILDEIDYNNQKYVMSAVVDNANKVTDQIALLKYIEEIKSFDQIGDEELIKEIANIFSNK